MGCYACEQDCEQCELPDIVVREAADLATLERLLRCSNGGWLEVRPRGAFRDEWYAGCTCGLCTAPHDSPAEAILAFHREHGANRG